MKKYKWLFTGIVALLMTGGLFFFGCAQKCPDDKGCTYSMKTVENETKPVYDQCSNNCISTQFNAYMAGHPQSDWKDNPPNLSCDCGK